MRDLLSHFQITPKAVMAYLVAFAAYIQNLGHMPETPRQWGVVVGGFVLSTLVPAREPGANKDPQAAPTVPPPVEGGEKNAMKNPHLQIVIQADVDNNPKNGNEINVTPIDLAIPSEIADRLTDAINLADVFDAKPGNGQLDEEQKVKIPVKVNLYITTLKTTVTIDAVAILRVVDKP